MSKLTDTKVVERCGQLVVSPRSGQRTCGLSLPCALHTPAVGETCVFPYSIASGHAVCGDVADNHRPHVTGERQYHNTASCHPFTPADARTPAEPEAFPTSDDTDMLLRRGKYARTPSPSNEPEPKYADVRARAYLDAVAFLERPQSERNAHALTSTITSAVIAEIELLRSKP